MNYSLFVFTVAALLTSAFSEEKEFSLDILTKRYEQALDNKNDIIKLSKDVPDAQKPHGELRVLHRGSAKVIQSLLFTRFPSRFLKEIQKKEAIAWPVDMPGKSDSNLYLAAVELAIDYAKTQYPFRKDKEDKRKKLLIEVIRSPKHCFVAFFTLELDETGDKRVITRREVFSIIPLSEVYANREMTLMIQDTFGYDRKQAEAVLGFTIPEDTPEVKAAMEAALKQTSE